MATPKYQLNDDTAHGWGYELDCTKWGNDIVLAWICSLNTTFADKYDDIFQSKNINGAEHFTKDKLGDQQWCQHELGMDSETASAFSAIVQHRIHKHCDGEAHNINQEVTVVECKADDARDLVQIVKTMTENRDRSNMKINDDCNLVYDGKVLSNESKLQYYGIQSQSLLKLAHDSPLDDPNYNPVIQSTIGSTLSVGDHATLTDILRSNNLHKHLDQPLKDNEISLEMLQNDLPTSDIEGFCADIGLTVMQKMKFRTLMRIIQENEEAVTNDNANEMATDEDDIAADIVGNILLGHMIDKQKELDEKKQQTEFDEFQALKQGREFIRKNNLKPSDSMSVVLIGDVGSGKTSLMTRYINGTFNPLVTSTIGVDSLVTKEELANGTVMEITVWDTAGQERFAKLIRGYYKKGECIIVCYDASTKNPLETIDDWRKDIEDYGNENAVVIIVGCKKDLVSNEDWHRVNLVTVQSLIEDNRQWMRFNANHSECSAKTGDGIQGIFLTAAELVLQARSEQFEEQKQNDAHANNRRGSMGNRRLEQNEQINALNERVNELTRLLQENRNQANRNNGCAC
eukprot:328008_1